MAKKGVKKVTKKAYGRGKAKTWPVAKTTRKVSKKHIHEPGLKISTAGTPVLRERARKSIDHHVYSRIQKYGKETGVVGMVYWVRRYKENWKTEYAKYQLTEGTAEQRREARRYLKDIERLPLWQTAIKDEKYFMALYGQKKFYKVTEKTNVWKRAELMLRKYGDTMPKSEKKYFEDIVRTEKGKTEIKTYKIHHLMEKSLQGDKEAFEEVKKYADYLTQFYNIEVKEAKKKVKHKTQAYIKEHYKDLKRKLGAKSIADIPYNLKRHKNASEIPYWQVIEWFIRGAEGKLFNVGLRKDGHGLSDAFKKEENAKHLLDFARNAGMTTKDIVAKYVKSFNLNPDEAAPSIKNLIRNEEFKVTDQDDKGINTLIRDFLKKMEK